MNNGGKGVVRLLKLMGPAQRTKCAAHAPPHTIPASKPPDCDYSRKIQASSQEPAARPGPARICTRMWRTPKALNWEDRRAAEVATWVKAGGSGFARCGRPRMGSTGATGTRDQRFSARNSSASSTPVPAATATERIGWVRM